ncbi:hypothetical protein BDY19DRAFT_920969 [Irpex rosettiformis]|uniref:Uncharacterized protein n=1 Tax=Irpex rosettiformis TaxID=378272 RepID=A0ACB8UFX9_9APHY|nr:hypothetical protein BDY19DRAFT_920969 [Irpex rosettiformis]
MLKLARHSCNSHRNMSKRSASSPLSTPRKRKNAGSTQPPSSGQHKLDSFFSPRPPVASTSGTPVASTSKPHGDATIAASDPADDIGDSGCKYNNDSNSDAALARRLAEQDGIDMSMLRDLEQAFGATAAASRDLAVAAVGPNHDSEVIDVDLLDDNYQQQRAEPSPSSKRSGYTKSRKARPLRTVDSRTDFAADSPRPKSPIKPATPKVVGAASSAAHTVDYPSLGVDPLSYPPDLKSPWPASAPSAPYSFLAHALSTLSGTRSRIAILNTLTNTLRTIIRYHPLSLCPALYLLSNSLSPPYSPLELGLGPSIISKAIQDVSGLTPAALKRLYNTTGDPGDVAFEAKSNVRTLVPHPPLQIVGVYESLLKIARAKGPGAGKQKQAEVEKLLVAAKGEEIRYLVRTLCQNLRVGAVRTSILTALARALVLTPPDNLTFPYTPISAFYASSAHDLAEINRPLPENAKKKVMEKTREELNDKFVRAEAIIKKVYVLHPNYDHISAALLEVGLEGVAQRLPLTVGIPLLPTLGSPTRSLDEIYSRLGTQPFAAEFKYDGQRAQIHGTRVPSGQQALVKIFSRHLEDMTDKYPDVVALTKEIFAKFDTLRSFILDSEIVAIDPADGSLKSFQELSNRARKDVTLSDIKVPVCVFAFDLMYLNDEILLEKPFRQRRSLLRSTLPPFMPDNSNLASFDHVKSCESQGGRGAVEEFWETAVAGRSEGLMIKLLDSGEVEEVNREGRSRRKPLPSTYEPDKRTSAWLKLKKDYVVGLGDSLDLVPIGAWHGNGRKAQWWSPILLAIWDPSAERLVAVCKCMSGFSDTFYKELRERYPADSETCAKTPLWDPTIETGGLRPEVYFKPQEVWEIRGADITISPVSVAALGMISDKRGLSLRFPRFMKVRDDKSIGNASTPEFLADMYRSQQAYVKKERGGADEGDLLDVEISESEIEESESDLEG